MNLTGEPDDSENRVRELLDLALETAQLRGYDAEGWILQRDGNEGYSAWVFTETETEHKSLFAEVVIHQTPGEAARTCVALAASLPKLTTELLDS